MLPHGPLELAAFALALALYLRARRGPIAPRDAASRPAQSASRCSPSRPLLETFVAP